jgi:hypothetical protein
MPAARLYLSSSLVLVAAATLLTACAQHGGSTLPSTTALAPMSAVLPDATKTPPPCTGQKDKKNDASVAATLSTKGGTFCVPSFGGYGGSISYPAAKPSVKVTITSSTTDYKHLPQLGTGTAIFYLQMALAGGTTFGKSIKLTGGLTGAGLQSGKEYTAYGEATVSGYKLKFGPCYAKATKGKYGGVLDTIGALLEYGTVPGAASGFFEIYSGKQATSLC